MTKYLFIFLSFLLFSSASLKSQDPEIVIKGLVKEEKSKGAIEGASVKISGSSYITLSNKKGAFMLRVPKKSVHKLLISHLSYSSFIKDVKQNEEDTLFVIIYLQFKSNLLDTIPILSKQLPETLVGKPNYSIYDFDFYENKIILLTSENKLSNAQVQLSDYNGKIYSYYKLPKSAGEAKKFFHDYEGYTELLCSDSIFRLDVFNTELIVSTIPRKDFDRFLKPVSDSLQGHIYFSNQWDKYPSFNYYYLKTGDSISRVLNSITNEDLLKLYNFEYYFLPSGMQLEARRMADYYKTDKHIIAAIMSGFTQSMFYEPLYAPLFVLNDTLCIFNHHNNYLYHYNKQNKLIDSVQISYHHPKNWREWKKQLFVDEPENKVYAFFSKDGRHYIKQINHQTGKEVLTYKLQNHSAEKIKIKDGYVYYVYRPFGSTQERFLYREKIR